MEKYNLIHINVQEIPDHQKQKLAEGALELTQHIFSEPGAEARYQEWLRKRREGEANGDNAQDGQS